MMAGTPIQIAEGAFRAGEIHQHIEVIGNLIQAIADPDMETTDSGQLSGIDSHQSRACSLDGRAQNDPAGMRGRFYQGTSHTAAASGNRNSDMSTHNFLHIQAKKIA